MRMGTGTLADTPLVSGMLLKELPLGRPGAGGYMQGKR